jgi:copper chaperone CopZ
VQLAAGPPLWLGAGLLFLLSMASAPFAQAAADETVLVSIRGLSCEACVAKATKALETLDSVEAVKITLEDGSAVLTVESDFDRDELKNAISAVDLELLFADETPTAHLSEKELASLDVQVVTHGKKIKLEDYLAKGKFTMFDFTAAWCKPCQILSPKLEQMVKDNDDIALRMVDIVDWKSDMAKYATKKYKLSGIPFVRVYGPDGKHLGDVTGLQPEKIAALIEEARS